MSDQIDDTPSFERGARENFAIMHSWRARPRAPLIVDTADIALPMLQKMIESRVTHHTRRKRDTGTTVMSLQVIDAAKYKGDDTTSLAELARTVQAAVAARVPTLVHGAGEPQLRALAPALARYSADRMRTPGANGQDDTGTAAREGGPRLVHE